MFSIIKDTYGKSIGVNPANVIYIREAEKEGSTYIHFLDGGSIRIDLDIYSVRRKFEEVNESEPAPF